MDLGGIGGAGGAGYGSTITGASIVYGGGGGGGGTWDGTGGATSDGSGGLGGAGGGGAGAQLPGTAAAAGTDGLGGGGGGGGRTDGTASVAGGDGGDGVVIARYYTDARDLEVETAPGDKVYGGSLTTPVVQIQDGAGTDVALEGIQVTATLTSGTGTLTNESATTNASGTATFTGFALEAFAGDYTIEFRASLLSSVSTDVRVTGRSLTVLA
jgi:hypothetical protein